MKIAPDLIQQVDLNETQLLNADRGYIPERISEVLLKQGVHPNVPNKKKAISVALPQHALTPFLLIFF